MRRFILALLFLSNLSVFSVLSASGGGESASEGDEISMVVLDEIFDKASRHWKTSSDLIWNDYSAGLLTVKNTAGNASSYDLHSNTLGDVTIKVESVESTRVANDQAVEKMRADLLLDTEEKTDNEGGTEE